jgi:uncharacterized protein
MSNRLKTGIFALSLLGAGFAQPILKTGDCPTLTRRQAATGDDWKQFGTRPTGGIVAGTIQDSLPPGKSINCVQVPSGLRAEIVASELTPSSPVGAVPLGYLMYITFDDRGRVWALDVRDYPNDITTDRISGGKSRIVILEDANGDGALDNFKVFHTGLNIATSLEWVPGGVVLTSPPNLIFIPSTGDVAGTPVVLWKGMGPTGTYDTHSQTNSVFYGLDNWFYGHTGGMGCTTAGGTAANGVNCGGGRSWRFKHTALGSKTTAFETWSTGPSNAHGLGQMENGEIFQSGATRSVYSSHSIRGGGAASIEMVPNISPLSPITGDLYLWEPTNTAVSGHDFYTARLLPSIFNKRLYICEGATKLCHQDNIEVNTSGTHTGSTWKVNRMTGAASNIFASTDAWVAPLKVRTGPDAALWVIDWNNYLFLHNPASPGGLCRDGLPTNGCAWNNALRTKHTTRLFRIVPSDGSTHPVLNLGTATDEQLVAALSNTNFVWRMQAQKLLARKTPSAALLTSLENILKTSRRVDDMGNDPAVTHAVWSLEGMGQFASDAARWNPFLKTLLLHPAWVTRQNVLQAMPRTAVTSQAVSDQCSVNDDHGHVRFQALLALSQSPNVTGETAIWTTFQDVDAAVTTATGAPKPAVAAVTSAGIATAATRPCTPKYESPSKVAVPSKGIQPRDDLRFHATPNGFNLMARRQLESGELLVHDLRGQVAFRSVYDHATAQWSAPSARGLKNPMYFYTYRKNNGEVFKGKITVTGMNL